MAKKDKKVTNKDNAKETKNKKSFFKGLKVELKKVIWPTPKQLFNSTVAVITIVLITAIIVFILDFAFESINKYGIDRIKQSVQTIESTNTESSNTTTDNTSESENTTTDGNNTTNENANETENQVSSENNVE